ncbi:MAG: response regulator transcription factor [Nitrospinae bacterium]|nr:response regulator transcription factor [Nitrospinota bacterium]
MTATRVILAEDHTLVRAGIRALLENLAGIEVVGEAGDGYEALRLIALHQPDVVVMDIGMPKLNGLEATARVARDYPKTRVIILSMHLNEEYVLRALHAGAAGYLLKDAGTAELELALKAVAGGDTYLSPPVSKRVISSYVRRVERLVDPLERLTPRQREILQLIAEGHTAKNIAQLLNVSQNTVETHRAQLMERLDIHDVAGLVRYAMRRGLVTLEK